MGKSLYERFGFVTYNEVDNAYDGHVYDMRLIK